MTETVQNKWWEKLAEEPEGSLKLSYTTAANALLVDSINDNKIVFNESFSGKLVNVEQADLIQKLVSELNLQEALNWTINGSAYQKYFVGLDSYLEVNIKSNNFQLVSNSVEQKDKFIDICKTHVEKAADRQGAVNVLVQGSNSLYLSTIGVGGIPLNKHNYSDIVGTQYDKVIGDLNAKDPSGRITIMTGEPGTGKTHLIRGLLQECGNVSFVFIPSYMVSNLSAPSLLPVLAEEAENGKPIVIVIEDADSCLVKRQSDNFSDVSTLLNLGDGILGSILDIRIICTTNAKQLEIDPAIKRNGRLCALIEVGKLNKDKANELLSSLLGLNVSYQFLEDVILADVYAKAKEIGWTETK